MLVETGKNVNSPVSISAVKTSVSSVSSPVIKEQKIHVVNVTSLERIWSLKWLNAENFKYCPLLFRDKLPKHVIWPPSCSWTTGQTQMNPVEIPAGEGVSVGASEWQDSSSADKTVGSEESFPFCSLIPALYMRKRTALTQEFRWTLKRPSYVAHHTVLPSGAMILEISSWFSRRND